ncbi:MAG: hypothetical protein HON65_03605 [Rhodospirillales bacterium]|nr:hypothetical protein [Rhodospirillales bacterium]
MENRHFLTSAFVLAIVTLPMVSGCSQTASFKPETQIVAADGTITTSEPAPGFTQIPDLPFPTGAKMNIERTFIVGSGDSWYGQTMIETSSGANATFDFYKQKLTEYDWTEVSSVRAQTSILTYMRSNRVLSIQISQTRLGKAEIMITVSPREGSDGL